MRFLNCFSSTWKSLFSFLTGKTFSRFFTKFYFPNLIPETLEISASLFLKRNIKHEKKSNLFVIIGKKRIPFWGIEKHNPSKNLFEFEFIYEFFPFSRIQRFSYFWLREICNIFASFIFFIIIVNELCVKLF
jgi:hypothetical protein